jgi:hypothetical protein
MNIEVKNKDELNDYLEGQWLQTKNDMLLSNDTRAICYWLYIIVKCMAMIFIK